MRYIDQLKIYQETDGGLDIFAYYFGSAALADPKHYVKAREEKTASARVSWYDNYWRITDFGNQSELNGAKAIEFVMWKENLEYYDALQFIERVIIRHEIDGNDFSGSRFAPEYSYRELIPTDKKGEYKFTFKEHPSKEDLEAFGRYVTEEHLDHFFCKVIESYEYCGNHKKLGKDVVHQFKSTRDFPMFLFDDGEYKKMYKPHEKEKKNRFFYIGTKPVDYIYGLKQIKAADNEFVDDNDDPETEDQESIKRPDNKPEAVVVDLFRVSGESDAINLYSLGFHAYWLNSESKEFTWEMFKEVDALCKNHYQIMDLDPTGHSEMYKNALKHIDQYTIELPQWLTTKTDWRGNKCKDLKDFINISGSTEESTRRDLLVLKRAAMRVKFWNRVVDKKTKSVNYNLNMEDFFFFLKANGFYQMDSIYHKKAGYCYVKLDGKVANLIHPDDIKRIVKRFTKDWIRSKKLMDAKEILNKLNGSAQISEANLDGLPKIELNFKNFSRNAEFLHFNNLSLRINKDKIESIKHAEVPNYILGNLVVNQKSVTHLINHDFRLNEKSPIEINPTPEYQLILDKIAAAKTEEERNDARIEENEFPDTDKYLVTVNDNFIFAEFLQDLSRIHWRKELERKEPLTDQEQKEQNLMLANILFVLGYHASQYKDPAKAWLTLLQDYLISAVGTASGGSGKSLLSKSLTFVRASFYKGGKKMGDKKVWEFFYDGMTEFHDFIEIDDMHEFADVTMLYPDITGNREINPKNYSAFVLPYEDSGKMMVSYNYSWPNTDASTLRRLLNCAVSDYYHEKTKQNDYRESRSPYTKFNRRLYDDFTREEWNKFFNLFAYCIQMQYRFFKIQPTMTNLDKQQYRRIMASGLGKEEEFFKWANTYFTKCTESPKPDISPEHTGYFDIMIPKLKAFEVFKKTLTQKQQADYKANKFKSHVEAWCNYYGYALNPANLINDRLNNRITRTIDGTSVECLYISTANAPDITTQYSEPIQEINTYEKPPF